MRDTAAEAALAAALAEAELAAEVKRVVAFLRARAQRYGTGTHDNAVMRRALMDAANDVRQLVHRKAGAT